MLTPDQTGATARDIDRQPLAARIASAVVSLPAPDLPLAVVDKVKLCLVDLIGCAFEARDLPWSRQAMTIATAVGRMQGGSIIGSPRTASLGDAAFVNAVMGHGL